MQYMDELKVLEGNDRDTCIADPVDRRSDCLGRHRQGRFGQAKLQEQAGLSGDAQASTDVEDWAATFAATSPYETFRLQLSLMTFFARGPRSREMTMC